MLELIPVLGEVISRDIWEAYIIYYILWEAAWPSGQRIGLAILLSWVRVPLWPLAGFVLGRSELKSLAGNACKQPTGCLLPVGVLKSCLCCICVFELFVF